MVARDNRLMGNMQSPTHPPPPFSICWSAFDPPSPLKSASSPPPPPQSIACYLLMLSSSFPTCVYVWAHAVYVFVKVWLSSSSASFFTVRLPAPLVAKSLPYQLFRLSQSPSYSVTLPSFIFSSSNFHLSHYHSRFHFLLSSKWTQGSRSGNLKDNSCLLQPGSYICSFG